MLNNVFNVYSSFLFVLDYEITHPIQVDTSGIFLSHHLKPVRRKRSTNSEEDAINKNIQTNFTDGRTAGRINASTIHLQFSAFAQDFVLELDLNDELTAPGFTVQCRKGGETTVEDYIPELHNCHYHGHLRSHMNSAAAVSLCDGMVSDALIEHVLIFE